MSPSPNLPSIDTHQQLSPGIQSWFRYFIAKLILAFYLGTHPQVRSRITFEVDCPPGDDYGVWQQYDYWPQAWKNRLAAFLAAYRAGATLPMEGPLPLGPDDPDTSRLFYRSIDHARDTYLAQVAHVLWLETSHIVPWSLDDYSDHELTYLLSSINCFRATTVGGELRYVIYVGGDGATTGNVLHDPRDAYAFMLSEPEQGRCLIGETAAETCSRLTEWFHDYLWHNPGGWNSHEFWHEHPLLMDRLQRYDVLSFGNIYVTPIGCWSASALFADLMRSVNVPIRKVRNNLKDAGGQDAAHCGLLFNWQGAGEKRYLLHTDDIYQCYYRFQDPAPAPAGTPRGTALWDHVWLSPSEFGESFAYSTDPQYVGVATFEERDKYMNYRSWRLSSWSPLQSAYSSGFDGADIINSLVQNGGFTQAEAQAAWQAVEETLLSYGNGDPQAGYEALMVGPESRHCQWCARTGKCGSGDPCIT